MNGIEGVFIPIDEFQKGKFLNEQEKLFFQEKLLEQRQLIEKLQQEVRS